MDSLLGHLITRLKSKFGGNVASALAAAGGGAQATRELRLFTRLSGYVQEPLQAGKLIELFLPYLKLKSTPRTERVKEDALRLLEGLISISSHPEQHVHTLSLLFGTLRARGSRTALCSLYTTLVSLPAIAADPEMGSDADGLIEASIILKELNAYSQEELEEREYVTPLHPHLTHALSPSLILTLSPPLPYTQVRSTPRRIQQATKDHNHRLRTRRPTYPLTRYPRRGAR